jgi:hypothetical protein
VEFVNPQSGECPIAQPPAWWSATKAGVIMAKKNGKSSAKSARMSARAAGAELKTTETKRVRETQAPKKEKVNKDEGEPFYAVQVTMPDKRPIQKRFRQSKIPTAVVLGRLISGAWTVIRWTRDEKTANSVATGFIHRVCEGSEDHPAFKEARFSKIIVVTEVTNLGPVDGALSKDVTEDRSFRKHLSRFDEEEEARRLAWLAKREEVAAKREAAQKEKAEKAALKKSESPDKTEKAAAKNAPKSKKSSLKSAKSSK